MQYVWRHGACEGEKVSHEISENTRNSAIEYCIDEYVRLKEHREILRERWFEGMTISQLAEKHHKADTSIKDIIYGIGDKILLKASKMK